MDSKRWNWRRPWSPPGWSIESYLWGTEERPMSLNELRMRIERRHADIGVIGLGYVGLPVACTFAQAGFCVIGVDVKADRVQMINDGKSPIEGEEPGLAELVGQVVRSR